MKKFLFGLCAIALFTNVLAQDYNPNRYQVSIFDAPPLSITDVKYGEAPQWIWPYWDIDLNLDVYVPDGDDNPKRPLIIFAHSGGFINGSKDVDNMVAICDSFARKGFVTASIDYRKGFDPLDAESAERAVYRGIQDGKAAVRYFKENAGLYDIDTNYIFFGGMSAGGFISLHVAYMDKESERPESTFGGGPVNDLLCLDCAGNDYSHSSEVRAILDFWGGVDDTTIIESGDIPVLIMHGENDETVPFEYGHPFGLFTLPESYGGLPISQRVNNMDIPYEMYTSEGLLHMLDGSDNGSFEEGAPNSFWSDTLLPRTEHFLYELLKPKTDYVSPDSVELCGPFGLMYFTVTSEEGSYYEWSFDEESINLISGEGTNEVALEFNESGSFDITVVEFNEIMAAGDTLHFHAYVETALSDFNYSYLEPNYIQFVNLSGDEDDYMYTWYFGDGTTSDEFEPDHVYETIGEYDVMLHVESPLGCTDTSKTTIAVDALNLEVNEVDFKIYPNPFQETITLSVNAQMANLVIKDAMGRTVYFDSNPVNAEAYKIDASNWAEGLYFVNVQMASGEMRTIKIIKN